MVGEVGPARLVTALFLDDATSGAPAFGLSEQKMINVVFASPSLVGSSAFLGLRSERVSYVEI